MPVPQHRHPEIEQKIGQVKITGSTSTGINSPLGTKGQIWVYGSSDQALDVGSSGYVLTADPSVARGLSWKPGAAAGSPLTAKGDLYGYAAGAARIPIGSDNFVLTPVSTAASGLEWRNRLPFTTKGDLLVASTATSPREVRFPLGDNGTFLKAVTTASYGLAWSTIASGTVSTMLRGELLMQDGVTSPPIPIETEDGTDWIWQDVV